MEPTADIRTRLGSGLELGMAYVTLLASEDLVCEWVSPSVSDVSKWRPEELIGKSAFELLHPDDIPEIARLMLAEQRDPHPYGTDPARRSINRVRFRDADGRWIAFEFAANNQVHNPDVRGIVVVMAETNERRLLDDVYDSMANGAPLESTSRRVAELLSWQYEGAQVRIRLEGVGEVRVGEALPGARRIVVDVADGMGQVLADHPAAFEPSEWCLLLADRAAGLLRVAVTRHLGEQTLRRRLDEKTALISAVSHDLRSPVAAIRLMSELLQGGNEALSDDQRRELAQRIGADARRTSRMLADLTSLDRMLHGSNDVVTARVVVLAIAERLLDELDIGEHTVVVVTDGPAPAAHADPVLVERIIDNLVTNALRHTSIGARVEVSVETDERDVVVHVDDDGPGVSVPLRSTIFDAYVRGDESALHPGSGMGLYLVRTFAEVQGGRVWCGDSPLGGARFSVVLPRWTS